MHWKLHMITIPTRIWKKSGRRFWRSTLGDHLVNPPKLGILERKIKRVPHRRAIVIPSVDKTGGHGSHIIAVLWKDQLLNLLKETEK